MAARICWISAGPVGRVTPVFREKKLATGGTVLMLSRLALVVVTVVVAVSASIEEFFADLQTFGKWLGFLHLSQTFPQALH